MKVIGYGSTVKLHTRPGLTVLGDFVPLIYPGEDFRRYPNQFSTYGPDAGIQ